ncbi:unnamed protein product [Amoebophrya sp. A25]|nr:unnamed protein product [Amoebophrya sp. A25]|eukprot:GSA25T00003129001.1
MGEAESSETTAETEKKVDLTALENDVELGVLRISFLAQCGRKDNADEQDVRERASMLLTNLATFSVAGQEPSSGHVTSRTAVGEFVDGLVEGVRGFDMAFAASSVAQAETSANPEQASDNLIAAVARRASEGGREAVEPSEQCDRSGEDKGLNLWNPEHLQQLKTNPNFSVREMLKKYQRLGLALDSLARVLYDNLGAHSPEAPLRVLTDGREIVHECTTASVQNVWMAELWVIVLALVNIILLIPSIVLQGHTCGGFLANDQ